VTLTLTIAVLCALTVAGAAEKLPVPPTPQADPKAAVFEVASVKPNTSGSGSMSMGSQPGGGFRAVNSPLRSLIQTAFGVRDSELVGAPDWISSERFDVTARAATELTREAQSSALQTLLRERFKLTAHRDTREVPVYLLVLARGDRRLGPGLRPSQIDCSPQARAARPPSSGAGAAVGQAAGPATRPECGSFSAGPTLTSGGVTLAQLAVSLSRQTDRPVLDRTGLTGSFDVDLKWSNQTKVTDDGPSFFTAVQEQLGLRLEAGRGPQEILVIDSVERPTPD
jgi:uncharacterized protein (TIGR03435 family)